MGLVLDEVVEVGLHSPENFLVAMADRGGILRRVRTMAGPVDRLAHSHRDFGRRRDGRHDRHDTKGGTATNGRMLMRRRSSPSRRAIASPRAMTMSASWLPCETTGTTGTPARSARRTKPVRPWRSTRCRWVQGR